MNKWLVGNGVWCSACEGTGRGELHDTIIYSDGGECNFYDHCPVCKGEKRIEAAVADVIGDRVPRTAPKYHSCFSSCIEYRKSDSH